MIDDLRNSASDSYLEEEANQTPLAPSRKSGKNFLGMTAPQRFVLALLLLIAVIVLGSFCLLITGRIVLP
ncbi:MAG: hypothetical protein BGO78_08350 [Chloroflexi bacterium 44-23]|nr:MAG: hypothetical protein BGO78_08350 [Chloroflexi bacterium 44-23]